MSPDASPEDSIHYRLRLVEQDLKEGAWVDVGIKLATKHELELHGERGLFKALEELTNQLRRAQEDLTAQLRWTQRALWGLAASIILAAVAVALGG